MDSVGHSGTHAPQAMQSSVIFMDMFFTPILDLLDYKLTHAGKSVK
jgi:hypothetical protein